MAHFQVSTLRIFANGFAGLCFVLVFIAFVTPNWLDSDRRYYGAVFVKLGLWETCFRSFHDPNDLNQRKYYAGCRWILTDEYQKLRGFIEQPFFIAVQVFFTFGFTALLVACILVLSLHLCMSPEKGVSIIRMIGVLMLFSAVCCTLAVVVFGIKGDGHDWMPDPDHNYLSWSFGLAVVGTFFVYVASILFFIEARGAKKRHRERENQVVYRLEQTNTKV